MIVLAFVLWFVSILSCVTIARQKGRNRLRWVFSGILFGFLALIVLAVLPSYGSQDGAKKILFGTPVGRMLLALAAVVLSFIQLSILLVAIVASISSEISSTESESQASASITQAPLEINGRPDSQTSAPAASVRDAPTQARAVPAVPVTAAPTTSVPVTAASTTASAASSSQSAVFTGKGSAMSQSFQLDKGRYQVVVDFENQSYTAEAWGFAVFRITSNIPLLDQQGRGNWTGEVLVAEDSWSLWIAIALGDNVSWTVNITRLGDLPRPTPQPALTSLPTTAPSPLSTATPTPTLVPTVTPTPTPIRLTLTELLDEYEANKVRANARLRYQQNGKVPVSTAGYVYHVEELYAVIAITRDEYPTRDLRCYYADTKVALHISKGQSVDIIGRVIGTDNWSNSISMYKCEVDGIVLDSNRSVMAHDLRASVVKVFCINEGLIFSGARQGTGIIIDSQDGIMLTVHHVVADENECRRIELEISGIEGRVAATVMRHCASIDRARLQIPRAYLRSLSLQPIFRANAPAQADQEVYFLGYGQGGLRMENGIVTDVFGGDVVIDAYAVPGDSGSPVFDENGHLLGTVSSGNRSDRTVFTGEEC